eukprot:4815549-Alexandrium_andersonii.AAC.1
MSKGKTEAVIGFAGRRSCGVKRTVLVEQSGVLKVPIAGEVLELNVVAQYKHMGSLVNAEGDVGPELRGRSAAAAHEYNAFGHKLLCDSRYRLGTRCALVTPLYLARLLFHAMLWGKVPPGKLSCINNGYMR